MSSAHIMIVGVTGRLGSRIAALSAEDRAVSLSAAVARDGSPRLGETSISGLTSAPKIISMSAAMRGGERDSDRVDVVIDVSSADATVDSLKLAQSRRAAIFVCTTGLSGAPMEKLRAASAEIPVLVAANTSLGVAALAHAAAGAARALGPGYACSIVEAHHRHKKDAPSGTALRLAEALAAAGVTVDPGQILAIRGGDVVGEHTIRLTGDGEYIELTHRATSRDLFARGALRGAAWLAGRAAGWYTMEDVLGLGRA